MKIHVELDMGFDSGAIMGMLISQVKLYKAHIADYPNAIEADTMRKCNVVAEQVIKQIEDQVEYNLI